jgi:hypothetical protein
MIAVSITYTTGIKGATSSDIFRLRMGPQFARRRPENIRAGLYLGCSRFMIAAITSINGIEQDAQKTARLSCWTLETKMELTKFLSLCGAIIGFIAVLFLSKVLFSSSEDFLKSTVHYSSKGWPSTEILSDAASQKADTIASVVLVAIALSMQICSTFISNDVFLFKDLSKSLILAFILVAIISFTVYQSGKGFKNSFEINLKKHAARDLLKDSFVTMSGPLCSDIENVAIQYFDFKRNNSEGNDDFIKRFSVFVDYQIPENADFTKFR